MADQLLLALETRDVSVRELARRMAEADGTDWEAKRRWLMKILDGEVVRPRKESLAAVARALKLPAGYFKTTPMPRREVGEPRTVPQLRGLLRGLAETVDAQQETIEALLSRMEALERAAARPRRASEGR